MASPHVEQAAASTRSERDVRAIRARRARLEADLIEEGASETAIATLATDDVAEKMIDHEKQTVSAILSLFGRLA